VERQARDGAGRPSSPRCGSDSTVPAHAPPHSAGTQSGARATDVAGIAQHIHRMLTGIRFTRLQDGQGPPIRLVTPQQPTGRHPADHGSKDGDPKKEKGSSCSWRQRRRRGEGHAPPRPPPASRSHETDTRSSGEAPPPYRPLPRDGMRRFRETSSRPQPPSANAPPVQRPTQRLGMSCSTPHAAAGGPTVTAPRPGTGRRRAPGRMSTGVRACTYGSGRRERMSFMQRQRMNGPGGGSRVSNARWRTVALCIRTSRCGEAARHRSSRRDARGGC